MHGSSHNDAFVVRNGRLGTATNNSGGIQGGISNGELIYFKASPHHLPTRSFSYFVYFTKIWFLTQARFLYLYWDYLIYSVFCFLKNLLFCLQVAFKPPATISQPQVSCTYDGADGVLEAKGRHDPCVVPRAVPIVEAMAALVLADAGLCQLARENATVGIGNSAPAAPSPIQLEKSPTLIESWAPLVLWASVILLITLNSH